MKTITINLYEFDDLSEEAKKAALNELFTINVEHKWWVYTYDDAENIGLKITSFDLDRNRHATGHFTKSALEVAHSIIKEHGDTCETHKTATKFLQEWDNQVAIHSDGVDTDRVCEDKEAEFDTIADDLEHEFLNSILEDYSIILERECEYLQSEEAIIETIRANGYTFEVNGHLNNG